MDATVSQIIRRREEIASHQKTLKDLTGKLNEDQRKELSDWEASAEGKAFVATESGSKPSPR